MALCSTTLVDLFLQRAQQIRMSALLYKNRLEVVDPYVEVNPSSGTPWTPFDLNMRRKAEILKYKKNAGDTSGSLRNTRAGKWAYSVRNRTSAQVQAQTQAQAQAQAIQMPCPAKIAGPMHVSMSNVPPGGDTDYLVYNDAVPLYNFTNPINNRTYDTNNTVVMPTQPVISESDSAVHIPNQSFGRVATFMYTNLVSQSSLCTIDVRIPLCLEIVATNANFSSTTLPSTIYPISVRPVVHLCYNERVIASISTQTIRYSWTSINLACPSNYSSFTIKKYIGYMTVTGIVAASPIPMSVFTIRLTTNTINTGNVNGNLTCQLIANPPADFVDINTNPQIQLTVTPSEPYQPFDAQFNFS